MAVSDLILKPGQILLTANQDSATGISLDNSSFIFGNVAKACEISDYYTAGGIISTDYVTISATNPVTATPSNTWYIGPNGVTNGNTGWIATDAPSRKLSASGVG